MNALPERIGAYRVEGMLGQGGMGVVYRARRDDGTPVALKTLHDAYTDETLARFEREAMVRVEHRNVVRVLESGVAGRASFIALELLDGESFSDRLKRGTVSAAELAGILAQACDGVAAIHAAGIVHRDLKPANLFLCADGTVKVLDFGIAQIVESSVLTVSGSVIGTPSYLAPEQARGGRDVDARSDVWALGIVAYEALCGRRPFDRGSSMPTLVAILFDELPPLRSSAPQVPRALAALVERCLAKSPDARFGGAAELAAALRALGTEGERAFDPPGPDAAEPSLGLTPTRAGRRVRTSFLADEVRVVSVVLGEGVRDAEAFAAEIARRGGVASALRGGRAVGVFGGAEWLGDEPERAVRAALAACGLATRIGVGTERGEVRGGAVAGAAVAAAEEALGRVGPGEVGSDTETRRRVLSSFDVEGARVVREQASLRPVGLRGIGGADVPMLGRERELSRLAELLDRAAAESRAQAAVVVGPPGIGKSRLRAELERLIEGRPERISYLEARGESDRAQLPLAAMAVALRLRLHLPEGSAVEAGRARITEVVAGAKLPADRERGTAEFLGEWLGTPFPESVALRTARADAGIMRDRIRLAVGDLVEGLAAQGPVVLVVEDAHWADPLSLEYVDFLLGRLAERPLVVVATARPELFVDRPDAFAGAERIELRELGARDVSAIVSAVLGRDEPALVERAAGNPFFAEELALAAREGIAELPVTVQGALQARFDQLPPGEKNLLKRAAVLGRRFWVEALEALGAPAAADHLKALRRRDLVAPRPEGRLAGCTEWVFRHALIEEVARAMLLAEQARELHRKAARWLASRPDAPAEDVAAHLEAAGDGDAATPYWLRAVDEANRRGDAKRSVELCARLGGRELSPDDAYGLRLTRASALFHLGRHPEAREELERARAIEREATASPAVRADVRRLQSFLATRNGQDADAIVFAEEALAAAREAGDPALEACMGGVLAQRLTYVGRHDEAAATLAAAETQAVATGDAAALARTMDARGHLHALRGDKAGALACAAEAARLYGAAGDVQHAIQSAGDAGARALPLGAFAEARERLEAALRDAQRLAVRVAEGYAHHNLGLVLHRSGETAAALAAEDAAIGLARELGVSHLASLAYLYRSLILAETGEAAAALQAADLGLSEPGLGTWDSVLHAARAIALLAGGRPVDALAECDRALALRDANGGMEEHEIDLLLCRRDALVQLGRDAEAAAALDEARAVFDARLACIDDSGHRRTFSENIPAHARLLALSREGGA